jgi:PAS domain S-box-containing protein
MSVQKRAKGANQPRRPRNTDSLPAAGGLTPLRIAGIYLIGGFTWFLVTDEVIRRLFSIPIHLLIIRGAVFIATTAVVLYFLVRRYQNNLSRYNATLLESTERANTYFESAAEGIIVVDHKGSIVRINGTVEKLFGYSAAEIVGKPIQTLVPNSMRKLHEQDPGKFFEKPHSGPMGLGLDPIGRRKDGTEFPIEVNLSVVDSDKGLLAVAFLTDVTERRALEHEARRGRTLATLGMVAAGIVHEINNPISIISSRAELLLADGDAAALSPELRADLEVLHRSALRVGRISQGLLKLARQGPKTFTAIDINNVIEEALLLVSRQMGKEGIRIETGLEPSPPRVYGDSTALEEVIINLVMNAREAAAVGGTIRVETQTVHASGARMRIVVADNGPGIPADEIERLFDPFFSTKAKGVGIGLWLSKRIIQEHRGDIVVESEKGKGTRFLIHLPLACEQAG